MLILFKWWVKRIAWCDDRLWYVDFLRHGRQRRSLSRSHRCLTTTTSTSCQVTSGQTRVSYLTWSYLLTLQCVFVSGDVRSDSSLLLDLILSSYITTCLRVRWRQVRLESLTWLDLIFLHYNLCWMLAQSTVGLEKEAQYQHNCFSATLLSTFIMVCTVQWYEQFLQVVRLYQALILLGLALYLPRDSVSSIFMVLYI